MSEELFSTRTEEAVLSLILNNPELVYKAEGLKPSMFSSTSHTLIFSIMVNLREENHRAEVSLVKLRLESSGRLSNAGGIDYLEYLHNQKYDERNFEEFVRMVIESYKAQALLSLTNSVKIENLNIDSVSHEIQRIKAGLDSLSQTSTNNNVAHIGDLTQAYYDEFIKRIEHPGVRGVPW
jgi:replicative DNA helicase